MKISIKTCFDFFIFAIFFIFISIFKLFPSSLKLKISEILGVFLFYVIPKGRKLSYKNLNLILNKQYKFNYSKKELKKIALKSYKNTAKSFLLPFWIYEYGEKFPAKVYNTDLYLKLKEKTDRMLGNPGFLAKAPEAIVLEEKDKLAKFNEMLETIEQRINNLK